MPTTNRLKPNEKTPFRNRIPFSDIKGKYNKYRSRNHLETMRATMDDRKKNEHSLQSTKIAIEKWENGKETKNMI